MGGELTQTGFQEAQDNLRRAIRWKWFDDFSGAGPQYCGPCLARCCP